MQTKPPRVLNDTFLSRLAESNQAVRQLRSLGVKVIRQVVVDRFDATQIVIDRNPHCTLPGFPRVQVTVER